MSAEITRYIDSIARDKEIDGDALYEAVEAAVAQALSKKYAVEDLELKKDYYEQFKQGVIGLQVHSVKGDPKWSVSWRNIYIKELD